MSKKSSGLIVAGLLALLSLVLGTVFPIIGSSVFAIVLGILLNNTLGVKEAWQDGLAYSGKKLLQYAIICLGFTMSIGKVSQVGLSSLQITLLTIAVSFIVSYFVGKWLGLNSHLKTLIGFGTAICGGSAIAAASPILDAEEDEVALSISTIFLFNIIAVFLFPALGHLMGMTDFDFGLWAGTAINDTSSVVAAGYAYSQTAGDIATIVKLARALMIVPACLILAGIVYRKSRQEKSDFSFKKVFPWFILWFLLASIFSSLFALPEWLTLAIKYLSQFLMAMALAGIGSKVSYQQFKSAGLKPVLTGLAAWFAVAASSLILQYFLF
ncbi:YeiH family protein [Streptococcus loxodontisalivarius]|uniref:Integral membrane protein (TIGR00698 family) n=1 Tax=Streptococcus loxodontisalivarius TaxID=1349415 RepID=A0ABS2PQ67_9STRE|nr:YeiH family protein [Streptococcus loxodontisalivarius]MBM7642182.1 putative integral membrane protein (TIGR00698 family) [Streptococcus loxodontisalivarius]